MENKLEHSNLISPEVEGMQEERMEKSLRPQTLDEYIGQTKVKENMRIYIEAAKKRGEPLDHCLFYGPPGLGKTTIANIIANEMKSNIKITSGPAIEKPGDLAAILTTLSEYDVLFIDEIHRLSKNVEEILYPALEDYTLDIVIGTGASAKSIRIDLPKFTLIGATTKAGSLTTPLRDRFGIIHKLELYEPEDLQIIVKRSAKILDVKIDDESAMEIARRSRGTPRIANRLLKRVRDYAAVLGNGDINLKIAKHALNQLEIDELGLDDVDRRKRVYTFPKMGEKAYFIAVPTSAGTGSEVTPFAVITDETTGQKYPLADYELLPKMAIVDANLMMNAPKGLTSASGADALVHAIEAYASMMATEFTDGLAIEAIKTIFEYLPRAYENGANDPEAREKMANAATMAGMAFANAFLGICHSMGHKLGAYHHLPHGITVSLVLDEVMRFNSAEVPNKMGTFPQYDHPHTLRRYAEIAEALNIGGANDYEKMENLISKIDELKERIGIKKTIREYGIEEQDFLATLDEMSEKAFDDQCTGANPRYPLISEIKDIYLKVYYGN